MEGRRVLQGAIGNINLNFGKMRAWRIVNAEDAEGTVDQCLLLPLAKNGLAWWPHKGGGFDIMQTLLVVPYEFHDPSRSYRSGTYKLLPYINNTQWKALLDNGLASPDDKWRSRWCGEIYANTDNEGKPRKLLIDK